MDLLIKRVYDKRLKTSYSQPVTDAINLVTYNEKNVIPYGSSVFKAQRYAGDYDLIEYFKQKNNDNIELAFKKIIQKIKKTDDTYITDIKCGIDKRFKLRDEGEIKNLKIVKLNKNSVKMQIDKLFDEKLLSKKDYLDAIKYLTSKKLTDYMNLLELFRLKCVIRWTPEEVLNGKKTLVGGQVKLLKDALIDNTITKIDLVVNIEGIYTEFTNVLVFEHIDTKGKISYTAPVTEKDVITAIKYQILELFYSISKEERSYLKGLKRIFTLARFRHDLPMLKKIFPILNSDIAIMHKVRSDMKVLLNIIKTQPLSKIQIKNIKIEASILKQKLSNIVDFKFNEPWVDTILNNITYKSSIEMIKNKLEALINFCQKIINRETLKYMKKNGLMPVSRKYLP